MRNSLQTAVESAQVLAGIVSYPDDNPFYLYHVKTWTLLHQIPALMLAGGMSERVISMLMGVFIGAISFQALALCTLVCSRKCWLAMTLPFILHLGEFHSELLNIYPLQLLSTSPWVCYGVTGTSWVGLCWALYAAGFRRLPALLTGVAPAIHPTLGLWLLATSLTGMFLTRRRFPRSWRSPLIWLAIGIGLTTVSYIVHLYHARVVPSISVELRDTYVRAFSQSWDTHRAATNLFSPAVYYGLGAMAVCFLWLRRFSHELDEGTYFLLCTVFTASTVGMVLVASSHFPEWLPTIVLMAMPGRYINVACLVYPTILLGLLCRGRNQFVPTAIIVGSFYYMILRNYSREMGVYIPETFYSTILVTLMLLGSAWRWSTSENGQPSRELITWRWICLAGLVLLTVWHGPQKLPLLLLYTGGVVCALLPNSLWDRLDRLHWRGVLSVIMAGVCSFSAIMLFGYGLAVSLTAACAGVAILDWRRRTKQPRFISNPAVGLLGAGVLAVALLSISVFSYSRAVVAYCHFYDYRGDALLHRVYRGKGMLLASSTIRVMQLLTRRPVMLEGAALNQLPYVPESGPSMSRILRRIYQDDVLVPRPDWWKVRRGGLMQMSGKTIWQLRKRRSGVSWPMSSVLQRS